MFAEAGVSAGDIKSLDDIAKLLLTTKQDLRNNYPFGIFAVLLDEIVQIRAASGTTGEVSVTG